MDCLLTRTEDVEPQQVAPGLLLCPACGALLDEETLAQVNPE